MALAERLRSNAVLLGGAATIFVAALVARVGVVLSGAGYHSNLGYDDSVYYAAADAFIHGRMPYRDFVLLHPPGIMLLLSPFAGLGDATSDHTGFIVADLAFTLLAAVNAVLVVVVAHRIGLHRSAALVAGACYALYVGAVTAEYSTRLEPLGNFFALCGLLAFFSKNRTTWRVPVLCGVAFGAATCVKIWWAVPLVVMVLACVRLPKRAAALYALGGAAATIAVIDGPFLLMAPHQMWTMVVGEQVGRPHDKIGWLTRLDQLTSLNSFGSAGRPAFVVAAAVLLAVLVLAWQVRAARPIVAMAVLQVAVLCVTPSWFYFYPDFVTVAAALTFGAAAHRLAELSRDVRLRPVLRGIGWIPAVFLAASLLASYTQNIGARIRPFPGAPDMAAAVTNDKCVMSTTPMALIEVNALSRDFAHGCPNWVDVVGMAYGSDRPPGPHPSRLAYPKWQHALRRYLTAGNAAVITKRRGTGMDPTTLRYVGQDGLLENDGQTKVFRTQPTNPRW